MPMRRVIHLNIVLSSLEKTSNNQATQEELKTPIQTHNRPCITSVSVLAPPTRSWTKLQRYYYLHTPCYNLRHQIILPILTPITKHLLQLDSTVAGCQPQTQTKNCYTIYTQKKLVMFEPWLKQTLFSCTKTRMLVDRIEYKTTSLARTKHREITIGPTPKHSLSKHQEHWASPPSLQSQPALHQHNQSSTRVPLTRANSAKAPPIAGQLKYAARELTPHNKTPTPSYWQSLAHDRIASFSKPMRIQGQHHREQPPASSNSPFFCITSKTPIQRWNCLDHPPLAPLLES